MSYTAAHMADRRPNIWSGLPQPLSPLHLLQQDLDDALLLCAVSRELISFASELVELCVRLEAQDLEVGVTTVIHQVEEVDKDGLQNLYHVSKVHRGLYHSCEVSAGQYAVIHTFRHWAMEVGIFSTPTSLQSSCQRSSLLISAP
jgi:hypothetical protein